MRKAKLKWQIQFVEQVKKMSNETLLDETLCLAGGDDYDGYFTTRGSWEYDCLLNELHERLGDWLKK